MKTGALIATESSAFLRVAGVWCPLLAPSGKYPQRWFASSPTIDAVQALIRTELAPQIATGLPLLIITREVPAARQSSIVNRKSPK